MLWKPEEIPWLPWCRVAKRLKPGPTEHACQSSHVCKKTYESSSFKNMLACLGLPQLFWTFLSYSWSQSLIQPVVSPNQSASWSARLLWPRSCWGCPALEASPMFGYKASSQPLVNQSTLMLENMGAVSKWQIYAFGKKPLSWCFDISTPQSFSDQHLRHASVTLLPPVQTLRISFLPVDPRWPNEILKKQASAMVDHDPNACIEACLAS